MGTRFVKRKRDYHPYDEYQYRLVYWDDGSVWDESNGRGNSPRPANKGEMWVVEAVQQFKKQLLTGKSVQFTINFTNGNKFVGKLVKSKPRSVCAEGDYFAVVHIEKEDEPRKGWINGFKPTPKTPDIVQYVHQRFAQEGHKVERVEIKESKIEKGGKKWAGVFFHVGD